MLRNIHLGAVIEGLYRQDVYEIPPAAIRELIINAAVHRSYLDNDNIQVAIFDNRLEITSPGKLPIGQTITKMREGYSKVRNEALAMAFSYMHLIERWGTGMLRVAKMIKEAGLGELEILGGETELRFNIYRKQAAGQSVEVKQGTKQAHETEQATEQDTKQARETEQVIEQDTKQAHGTEQAIESSIDNNEKLVLDLLCHNRDITISDMAKKLEWSRSKVVYYIEKLKQNKIIERVGSSQKGYWKVTIGDKANG